MALSQVLFVAAALASTNVTADDAKGTDVAFGGEVLLPINDGFGGQIVGYGANASMWGEFSILAIQPKFGFDYGPGQDGAHFFNLNWELGIYALPIPGPITPIIGGGVGARFVSVKGPVSTQRVGTVIVTQVEDRTAVDGLGVGLAARAGVLFFRQSPARLMMTVEYSIAFIDDLEQPQALLFSIGMTAG